MGARERWPLSLEEGGRGVGGRRCTGAGRACCSFAACAPTILQREATQAPPRPTQQVDATYGALASPGANLPTSTSRRHGRRGETEEVRQRLRIRQTSAPPS